MEAQAEIPLCRRIRRRGEWATAQDRIALSYEARLLRRKRLAAPRIGAFYVDLAETVSLDDGDGFALEDGRLIAIEAADEPLLAIEGNLPRLAWHIGNRHTPCQIEPGRLLIRSDHVLRDMLRGLGAEVAEIVAPFRPEGGAYGQGRTMGHDHRHQYRHDQTHRQGHDHRPEPGHGRRHEHGHGQGHDRGHGRGSSHAHDHDHAHAHHHAHEHGRGAAHEDGPGAAHRNGHGHAPGGGGGRGVGNGGGHVPGRHG